jgi:nucleotide-binding universal stress UspA family protein
VEHLMAEADPRLVLDSFSDAALMAIGPRGTGRLKHLFIGSTAEWLISAHRPLTPLVIVRSARPSRQVLLCVDGSVHAQRAAETLASLPWIDTTEVTVLGVSEEHADVERGVEQAVRLLETRGVTLSGTRLLAALPHTATFDVRATILDTIAADGPDLVVMGTRGIGGLRRTVLGSTAHAVIHHAPCSVLIARAPEESGDH